MTSHRTIARGQIAWVRKFNERKPDPRSPKYPAWKAEVVTHVEKSGMSPEQAALFYALTGVL